MCLTDCIVDWGDVPTWVSGVAAAGALVAAVIAAVFTFNLLRLEGTRDERARQSQTRWQADQVAVWPSSEPLGSNVMFLSEGAWIAY